MNPEANDRVISVGTVAIVLAAAMIGSFLGIHAIAPNLSLGWVALVAVFVPALVLSMALILEAFEASKRTVKAFIRNH